MSWRRMAYLVVAAVIVAGFGLAGCAKPEAKATPTAAATLAPGVTRTAEPSPGRTLAPPTQQVLRLAMTEPRGVDPGAGTADPAALFLYHNCFDTLFILDKDAKPVLAPFVEKYDVSPDGKTHTFKLRKDLKWSDGTPFSARDFEWSLKRAVDPATGAEIVSQFYVVVGAEEINTGKEKNLDTLGVKALDDYTLEVKTKAACPYLPAVFTGVYVTRPVPRHAIEKWGDKWAEAGHFVSNGPWMIERWEHNLELVLVRNPYYYGPKPALEKIVFDIHSSTSGPEIMAAYEAGELDIVSLTAGDLGRVLGNPALNAQRKTAYFPVHSGIVLDTTNPPLDDIRVRQALYLAIDRQAIADQVFRGLQDPAWTFVCSQLPSYDPNSRLQGTVEDAKRLLAEAGYPEGKGFRKLTYSAPSTTLGEALAEMWKKNLGIEVEINLLESRAWYSLAVSARLKPTVKFDILYYSWPSDYVDEAEILYGGFARPAFWPQRLSDPGWDERCWQACIELNPDKRVQMFRTLEKELVAKASWIPIYFSKANWLVKPYMEGVWYPYGDNFQMVRYTKMYAH